MSDNAVQAVTRVPARRALVHRLVLLGLTQDDEAAVDGLALWRELRRAGGHSIATDNGFVPMFAEPGRGLDVLFDDGAGLIV